MDKYFTVNTGSCSIRCKLYAEDRGPIRRLVLFGHGFGGHKDNRAAERFARRALEKNHGVAVVCFDWPCHGEDVRKTLRLEDCDAYLGAVIAHIDAAFGSPQLYAYATSFGGYLFLKYISEHGDPFVKTALRCPAVDLYAVITGSIMTEEARERLRKGKPALVGFDRKIEIDAAFLESVRQADIRRRDFLPFADDLLILHGTKDEIVPIDAVKAFAEDNVIDFEAIDGADHRFQDPARMNLAIAGILAFFGMR